MPILTDLSPVFDRALRVARAEAGRPVAVRWTSAIGKERRTLLARVAPLAGGVELRLTIPGPATYVYRARGQALEAFDPALRERLTRRLAEPGLRGILRSAGVEDPPLLVSDPKALAGLLDPLRRAKGWRGQNPYVLETGESRIELRFRPTDGRLEAATLKRGDRSLAWTRTAPAPVSPVAPGYRLVDAFGTLPKLPVGSPKTLREGLLAWRHLDRATIRIGDETTLLFDGPFTGEYTGRTRWSYVGGVLTIGVKGRWYRGKAPSNVIPAYVSLAAGARPDPFALARAQSRVPMSHLLEEGARARLVGQVVSGGILCDLVAIDSATVSLSLFLAQKGGRLLSLSSQPKGLGPEAGRLLAFRYGPPSSRAGWAPVGKVRPLPALPIKP